MRVRIEGKPLEAERDGTLDPSLLRTDKVSGRLGHAKRKLPVHEVRMPPDEHLVQAAGCILDLAARVKLLALDELIAPPAVTVADTLSAFLPDRIVLPVRDQPHAVCAARADAAATVTDHGVQPEELRVVVIHVVVFVRILGVVLRCLCEGHLVIQLAILCEEARDAREHEVWLKLMAGIRDGVESGRLVPGVAVDVLRPA
mmetsp:Transcript_94922/g.301178  ORF Transcript_94922/g.301178 Transcript_94922/m.301178 type:complete len:201 (-) Transcript_94922:292-894(-)